VRYRVLSTSYGDSGNLAVTPAHRVLDLAVSRPLRPWMDAYATLENALDEDYYYALTPTALRSGQPRTLSLGVRFSVPTVRNQG
jgi:outer membrane receptor protein involved in Fe transport